MIIMSTFSEESTPIAQRTRDLLSAAGEAVFFAPHGTTGVFISVDDENPDNFVVYASDDTQDLDIVRGFDSLEMSWAYARIVAETAGLTEEDIDSDVYVTE
jgi:hypothetical protein